MDTFFFATLISKALVAQTPHQIKTVQARLQQKTGKTSCSMTIKRALKNLGYSFKRARRSLKERRALRLEHCWASSGSRGLFP